MRLSLAKCLFASSDLLLLDEPAAGVNPALWRKIFERIEHFRQKGISFFVIEHRLEILMEFASWIYVMDKGKVVMDGEPAEVINSPVFYDVYMGGG